MKNIKSIVNGLVEGRKDMNILNGWVLTGWSIMAIALSAAYGIKGIRGAIPLWAGLVIVFSLIIPLIVSFILFKRNPCSRIIGYLFPAAYGLALCAIMIVSETALTLFYGIPMTMLIVAYNDFRLAKASAIMIIIECVTAFIVNQILRDQWSCKTDETVIYFVALFMTSLFSAASTYLAQNLNQNKIDAISAKEQQVKEVIALSTDVANTIQAHAKETSTDLDTVLASAVEVDIAMSETVKGMENARQVIDEQLLAVQSIEQQTNAVNSLISNIETEIKTSNKEFSVAEEQVGLLIKSSEDVLSSSEATVESMSSLDEIVKNVTDIINIISHISGQTRLLSLNASIEAARAGAGGKGFAVVAAQIGKLAEQTNSATTQITEMIGRLEAKFEEMNTEVEQLVSAGELQINSINEVNKSFLSCRQSMDIIARCSAEQATASAQMEDENKKLSFYIEDLSAMDEEVYAGAMSAAETVRNTKIIVESAKTKMLATNNSTETLTSVLNDQK